MKPIIRRINDGLANVEASVAVAMLLLMLVVAFAQALLRNLTLFGVSWANVGLEWLSWADFILQKGTLWLAYLGASLAVHSDKHVAIDLITRVVGPRGRMFLRIVVGFLGCVICYYLARAFWGAILINGEERPADMELLTLNGSVHVCDASAQQLTDSNLSPGVYCYVRSFAALFGVRMDTPGAAFQLIVPAMLLVMSLRMLGNGIDAIMRFARGDFADSPAEHGLTGAVAEVAHDIDSQEKKL